MPYELAATGTVEPIQTVAVQAQVSGPIVQVAFREGQDVKKGQVLFELDPRPFQAALKQAEGLLARDHATAAERRGAGQAVRGAGREGVRHREQNDAARSGAAAATATVARARPRWTRRGSISSTPRSARRSRGAPAVSGCREGNLVRSTDDTPLVTINQIQPILVRFAVPASNLRRDPAIPGAPGSPVLASPTGGGVRSEGTLAFVDNAVDTTTGTILLKGIFPNTDGVLWPGEFVNVRLRLFVDQDALVVPASAVVVGPAGQLRLRHPARQHGGHAPG